MNAFDGLDQSMEVVRRRGLTTRGGGNGSLRVVNRLCRNWKSITKREVQRVLDKSRRYNIPNHGWNVLSTMNELSMNGSCLTGSLITKYYSRTNDHHLQYSLPYLRGLLYRFYAKTLHMQPSMVLVNIPTSAKPLFLSSSPPFPSIIRDWRTENARFSLWGQIPDHATIVATRIEYRDDRIPPP